MSQVKFTFFRKYFKRRHKKPALSVPEAYPLSPCIIPPYVDNTGVMEENKGYVPVSLLVRAIDDDQMLNIAVAGNYGVGKSSVINTAENKLDRWWRFWRRHRFIRISLASLLTRENKLAKEKHTPLPEGNVDVVTDAQIEYSILQQILYHDKPQTTPKSRIRRIHKTIWYKPWVIALLSIVSLISLAFIFKPSWASGYTTFDGASECVLDLLKWGPLVVLGLIFIILFRYLGRHYSFAVDKVGYKDVEMKLKEEMSVFNAYLDEIVYFFESTKYDVVVLEDLDRFANKEIIFYKLRELNTILNNSKSIKQKVNFVYAVLDDLFDATERVKFFDYIVTVIPVINSLNSYEKLKEKIRPAETFEKLGRTELWNLCDYLQDMRLLLNIVNEYNQFVMLLDSNVMSEKVLFGLIVYKNYVPDDFAKMYNKAGVVAGILEDADKQRKKILAGYDEEIAGLQVKIGEAKDNLKKKQIALRKRYLDKAKELTNYSSYDMRVRYGGIDYQFGAVAENPSVFQQVRDGNANTFRFNNSNSIPIPSFDVVDKNLVGINGFDATMAQYEEESKRAIEELESSIQSLSNRKRDLPHTIEGIYQAYTESLDEKLTLLGRIETQQLVKFLILNGYLDRHYQYYLSYFYPNSLSREDRVFAMRAARREGIQYDVRLNQLDEVIKRFSEEDFSSNESLLNVDLVREIFDKNNQYQSYRAPICNHITKNRRLDFILLAYKAQPTVPSSFFFSLFREFDFWNEIEQEGLSPEDQDALREIYVRFGDLREGRVNPRFRSWLLDNYTFFESRWDIITPKRALNVFAACTPVFTALSLKNTPELIVPDIIENRRYEFSRKNVNAIVRKLGFFEAYKNAAYSAIRDANVPALSRAVAANWSHALKSVFPDTSVHERPDTQYVLLNDSETPKAEVCRYLSKQRIRITYADLLQDSVLGRVFENSLVAPTWKNIYYYAVSKGKGLPLQFLYNNIFKDKVGDSLSSDEESAVAKLLVFSDSVKVPKYSEFVPLFTTPFSSIPFQIQQPRMKVLVEKKLLEFNPANYKFIFDHYPSLYTQFLVDNLDGFVLHPEDYPINKSDALIAIHSLSTKKAKLDFIRAIKVQDLVFDSAFVSIARKFIENGDLKVTEIGPKLLLSIIADAPAATRGTIGRRAILSLDYDKVVVTDVLNAMGGEYRKIMTVTTTSTITYSLDAIKICNDLVAKGYIANCEKKNSKIIIYKK
jgi:hypothetical protein